MKIGIAGAGIMGRLLALAFVDSGHQVTLYDNGEVSCSMTAAGVLAPVSELAKSERLIYQLGMEAMQIYWPDIIKNLDQDIYFRQTGSLVVAHPQDKAELINLIAMIDSKIDRTAQIYKPLTQNELNTLEPELSKFNEAYLFSAEGQLDNQQLMQVLKVKLQQRQVQWVADTFVTEITGNKIITAADSSEYDRVFDCRGMGAASVFKDLQAVRGELVWLHAPEVNIQRPIRFMHPRYGLYIAPRPENIYIVGASEIYANDYSPISVRSALELLTAAFYLHPAFAEARIIKTAAHCRPAFPDHLPRIKCNDDYIAVNGLYRHGFLIAPTLVSEIVRWMDKGKSGLHYPQIWEFE